MPHYLLQTAYTSEAWAKQLRDPRSRVDAVRPAVEKLGGTMHGAWVAFGEYDVVAILEMPDNVSAAAFSMAVSAGGGVKAVKTTPLMSVDEALEAMRKGAESGYRPPGA